MNKSVIDFYKNRNSCKFCYLELRKEYNKEYRNRPEVKRHKKEYDKVYSRIRNNRQGGREAREEHRKNYYYNIHPEKYLLAKAKRNAKEHSYEFNLEISDIIIPSICPYFGVPMFMNHKDFAPTVDRIDSNKGYAKGNIQIISWVANRSKSEMTHESFCLLIEEIAKFNGI